MSIIWRRYWLVLAGLVAFEGVSILAYVYPGARLWILVAMAVAVLACAWRNPVAIVYAVVAELIVGSFGHQVFATIFGLYVPIRFVLFGLLCIITVKVAWQQRVDVWREIRRALFWPMLLLVWVAGMAIVGLLRGHGLGVTYSDSNAYLYLFVGLAFWIILHNRSWRDSLLTILAAGVTLVALKSWVIMAMFSHDHAWLPVTYRWIRNTGVGEIMAINQHLFRVFFQSQIFGLLGFWFFVAQWLSDQKQRWLLLIPTSASLLAVLISMSRSFWVAGGVSLAVFAVIAWRQRLAIKRLWPVLIAVGVAAFMFTWAVNFPNPFVGPGLTSAVSARLGNQGTADAATARKNQIQPLFSAISKNPIMGQGFGATVTYYSTDPRVRGWRTTSAFELGYLDMWLKIGLVGLAILGYWIFQIARRTPPTLRVVIWPAVIALLVVQMFTPYINHPIGLGWLALMTLLAYERT